MALRDYQHRAIHNTYESLRKHKSCILQMPTGSGKTHVAMEMIGHGLRNGRRINFLVDRLTLLDQTIDKFFEAQIPLGVLQGGHPLMNLSQPVQIVSTQTLARRGSHNWPHGDLWIVDEAHTQYAIVREVMSRWNNLKYVGLSATPFTRGLGLTWDDLVVATTTGELIRQGYLSDFDPYGPHTPDLQGVRRSGNDFAPGDLEERMNVLTGDIVAHYVAHGMGGKALAFTPTVAYAQYLADEFNRQGVPANHVSGHDSDERRKEVLDSFRSGETRVVCNCDVLTKGFDLPDIMVGILARPTRSLSLHIQMCGRFLRKAPGKDKALILDHAGNIERLGFPDDPLPTTLDMGKKGVNSDTRQKDDPQPWNCPQCHALVPPKTVQCPMCGFIPRKKHEVEVKSGTLKKLIRNHHYEIDSVARERQLQQHVYSQLLAIQQERGYKPGWTRFSFHTLFDRWPDGLKDRPMEPTDEIRSWVISQQIRRAKRRQQ